MMEEPLITIAIPVRDRAAIVGRTLDSIAGQTYRPLKVILVDNGSADGSLSVLRAWRDSHNSPELDVTVISEPVAGAPAARNAALALVDTPWTMFFDSDDAMRPRHIESVVDAIKAHGDADIIGWGVNLRFIDGTEAARPFATDDLLYDCIMHGTLATQRYLCRTELYREAGGWDNRVPVWNDIELGVRLLCLPHDIKAVKITGESHVDVYQTERSITGMTFHANGAGREYAMTRMLATLPAPSKDIIALKRAILAAHYWREGYPDDARRLMAEARRDAASPYRRMLATLAYRYTRAGYRGIARILRHFY